MTKRGLRITRVYTRTGDGGKTRLAGGQPVWKHSLRVEAYGTVDELNAAIGVVLASAALQVKKRRRPALVQKELRWVQHKLFDLGGLLATAPGPTFRNMPTVTEQDVVRLEQLMDRCQKELSPLKEFIVPGGGLVGSWLHLARTICRRAERACVALARREPVDRRLIMFLNRLSDALFVLARWTAKQSGEPEVLWERH